MPHTRFVPRFTFTAERLGQLKGVVPEVFADGKVSWDALKAALGEHLEAGEAGAEHFGLFWPGKREAQRLAVFPSRGTLLPALGEGVNEGHSRNLFIEGDNLEVLKLLQKAYTGRVKMIYIDPPYNTGNDFVYKDDFRDPFDVYLKRTGQLGEKGEALTTNTRADGRFHSNWLSLMYPRLKLARTLLREDGVIFVSIDDNELHNLKSIMSELFGEENFIGVIVVQLNPRGRHLDRFIARTHEYVVVYAMDAQQQAMYQVEKDERMTGEYAKKDARGVYRELELRNRNPAFNRATRPNLYYPIFVDSKDGAVSPVRTEHHSVSVHPKNSHGGDSCWTWGPEKFARDYATCVAREMKDGTWRIYRKDYLIGADGTTATTLPKSLWLDAGLNNDYGKKAVQELFEGKNVFDFPKSVELIKKLLQVGVGDEGIVLDFFAGASTTAQAVLELNRETPGKRTFIMIQMAERLAKDSVAAEAGYGDLAELSVERIRRVIKKMKRGAKAEEDLGFRLLRLRRSSFRPWRDYDGGIVSELEKLFEAATEPLVRGWTPEGLLAEVMLLEGFPLDATVEEVPANKGTAVLMVTSDQCVHRLFVCLDRKLQDTMVDGLVLEGHDVFVCLDSALTDQAKQRLADRCILKTI